MNPSGDFSDLVDSFKAFMGDRDLVLKMLDAFPLPIEIFAPDGTSVFANRAWLEFNNISDANLILGKYNVRHDPVCIEIMGQDVLEKAFRGEPGVFEGVPVPIQDLVDRKVIDGKPFETATLDMIFQPIWDGGVFLFAICVMIVKNVYKGRMEIIKAKEYIDSHWRGKFDAPAVARAVNISQSHLLALFRQDTGMTMNDYYKKIKVNHIKDKLADKNLTVAEAFAACGEDSRGWMARVFKEFTGVSPKEYRDSIP